VVKKILNHPSGSPVPLPLREAATRLRDGDRQDGGWTHQDTKTLSVFMLAGWQSIIMMGKSLAKCFAPTINCLIFFDFVKSKVLADTCCLYVNFMLGLLLISSLKGY
jgi:hypothetical protein